MIVKMLKRFAPLAPGAMLQEGKRLCGTENGDSLKIWMDGHGLQ